MIRDLKLKQAAYVAAFMAVVQFAIQLSLLARGVRYITGSLTIDDTYYYLQTAWNTRQLDLVTFDGLHATNGVQLLWFLLVLSFAYLVNSKTALLFVTLAVSFLFNALCYVAIYKIGKVLKRPWLILIMSSLWMLQTLPFRIYSMGMENSLHAFVYWCAIWQCAVFMDRLHKQEQPNFWGLTIVLILNAWSRLDSALISVSLFIFCLSAFINTSRQDIGQLLKKHARLLAGISLVALAGFFAQLIIFRWMGDSYLPVSALVKSGGPARGLSFEALNKFQEVWLLGLPPILQGRLPAMALLLVSFSCIIFVLIMRVKTSAELRGFVNLWCCLLVAELLYSITIAVSGVTYYQYFSWYRSPSFVFWVLTVSLVVLLSVEIILAGRAFSAVRNWTPFVFSLVALTVAVYLFFRSVNFTSQLYTARYDAAVWISQNFLPETIFASWNAGQLGFFSNRTFINLDGVINNVAYYRSVLQGPTTIAEYLAENEVEYIVDYTTYGSVPDFPVIRSFPLDDGTGRSIHIWQVSPQASSAR